MKKNYKLLLALATAFTGLVTKAQVSTYVFTQYQGTYSPITGGTVFATSTTDDGSFCDPANPGTNNTTGPGIPIGFTFSFNTTFYDRIGVDNNGWISFGQSTLTPNPINMSNTGGLGQGVSGGSAAPALLQNHITALGRDLVGNGGNASLRVQTIGTAPFRVCVIQWTNYRPFGGSTSDNLNFQIRLNESTNIVDIVYDSWTVVTTSSGQVGLRGNSNADFNNRTINSPANTWPTSVAGTANTDVANWNTSGLMPSAGLTYEWIPPVSCSGAPASNTATTTFTMVCPNAPTNLGILNTYSNVGISYQWYESNQSALGPYTVIASGTQMNYAAPSVTSTTWYQVVITCSAGPLSTTSTPVNVMIAPTTTNTVPYYEGFEGITAANQLPNCSWSASSPSVVNQTYITSNTNNRIPYSGAKFASFRNNTNAQGDYFYSNGVQLEPGITYSAAVWYITDGLLGWSELSLLVGPNQSPTGLVSVASKTGAVTGQFYQLLSNTFNVPTSGLYYIAVKAVGNSAPQFLTFDDLSVTIPCSLNSPSVNLAITPTPICTGQEVSISATGADTYSWSTGDLASAISFTPFSAVNLNVVATSSLSGCSTTLTELILPNQTPQVFISSNTNSVCLGSSVTLQAYGNGPFIWNTTQNGPQISVAPTVPTSYTVYSTNASGCTGEATKVIGVNSLPSVSATISNPNTVCAGESVTLTGQGAANYQWQTNSFIVLTQDAVVIPMANTVYTLTGTDANGCSSTIQMAVNVSACAGIAELSASLSGVKVYPNPANENITVELNNGQAKHVEITDLTGRVIMTGNFSENSAAFDLQTLAAGAYYLKITSGNASNVTKLIKN